jgi:hypothetical protein
VLRHHLQAEYKKALDSAFIRATGPARILNYKQKVCLYGCAAYWLSLMHCPRVDLLQPFECESPRSSQRI